MRPVSTAILPDMSWEVMKPFWAATARRQLAFPHCQQCGTWLWYPKLMCPSCLSRDVAWDPVEPRGHVYTWTVVHRAFMPGVEDSLPFSVLQVQFDQAPGVTLLTNLSDDAQVPELALDVAVTFEFLTVPAGPDRPQPVTLPYAVVG